MVPRNLPRWFALHFLVDMLFAIPLLLAPEPILTILGWRAVDPFASRLVGAALIGIGAGTFIGRNAGVNGYIVMLNMKIVWSLSAIAGILMTMIRGGPVFGWLILFLFVCFSSVWIYYRLQINRQIERIIGEK